jgi:thymidylate synthase
LYQFIVRKEYSVPVLDLNMYQRSCDTFLGVPFNIASMAILLKIISNVTNMEPGRILWIGGDVHIYENHLEQVNVQLKREPKQLPDLSINKNLKTLQDIERLTIDDFSLTGYEHHPKIKAKLSSGI